jgi:hypothetical protein
MTSTTTRVGARRRLKASIGAGAIALLTLGIAGPAAAAAPTVTASIDDGILHVVGSHTPDRIALRLSADDPNLLQVDIGDDRSADLTFALREFDGIVVDAGNGDDKVRIDDTNGAFTTTKRTRIDGGNGDDTLLGGSGAEILDGGNGNDVIDGNGGADSAFLGRGDDTFIWDPGDGSDLVDGGHGSDAMVFNGAAGNEIMAASATPSGRVLFTRNLGGIVMDLDGIETIDVRALGGTDTVTVNDVAGTDLRQVNVDLAGALGGDAADRQADSVVVKGTTGNDSIAVDADGSAVDVTGLAASVRVTHADPALDRLTIDTLAGADAVGLDPAAGALIQLAVL